MSRPTPLIRFAALFGAAALCAAPSVAGAQDAPCMSRAEGTAVVSYLLPTLVESVADHCAGVLGGDTYLDAQGAALSGRLAPLAEQSWPVAKSVLERQLGTALPDSGILLDLGRRAITDGIATDMDARTCALTDGALEQLAPLPPRNLANVVSMVVVSGLEADPAGPFRICPAP